MPTIGKKITELVVRMGFDGKEVERGTRRLRGEFTNFGRGAGQALAPLQSGVARLTAGLGAFAAALTAANSIELAKTQLSAESRLLGVLKGNTAELERRKKVASELQAQSIVGDEVLLGATADLIAAGAPLERVDDALRAVLETSQATGQGITEVARSVGRSFGGDLGELGQTVPALKLLSKEALAAGGAVDVLNEAYGGTAATVAADKAGQIAQAGNTIGDAGERIGNVLLTLQAAVLPKVASAADRLVARLQSPAVQKVLDKIGAFVGLLVDNAGKVAVAVGALAGLSVLGTVAGSIAGIVTAGTAVVGLLATVAASPVLATLAGIAAVLGTIGAGVYLLRDRVADLYGRLLQSDTIFGTFARGLTGALGTAGELIASLFNGAEVRIGRFSASASDYLAALLDFTRDVLGRAYDAVAGFFGAAYRGVIASFNAIGAGIQRALAGLLSLVGGNVGGLLDDVLGTLRTFANAAIGTVVGVTRAVGAMLDALVRAAAQFASLDFSGPVAFAQSVGKANAAAIGIGANAAADANAAFRAALGVDYIGEAGNVGRAIGERLKTGFEEAVTEPIGGLFNALAFGVEQAFESVGMRATALRKVREATDAATAELERFKATVDKLLPAGFNAFGTGEATRPATGEKTANNKGGGEQGAAGAIITTETIANGAAGSIAGAFDQMTSGAKTFGEAVQQAAVDFARSVASMITRALALRAVKAALGGFGFNAGGEVGEDGEPATFNTGGLIPGRGPNVDSVPAVLTRGEYVLRRSAVDAVGTAFLDRLNAAGAAAGSALRSMSASLKIAGIDPDLLRAARLNAGGVVGQFLPQPMDLSPILRNAGGPVQPARDPFFDRKAPATVTQLVVADPKVIAMRSDLERRDREYLKRFRR